MEVLTLEQKIREAFQTHIETGGIISSPERLIVSVISGLDKWLENRQTIYRKENPEQAHAIEILRENAQTTFYER